MLMLVMSNTAFSFALRTAPRHGVSLTRVLRYRYFAGTSRGDYPQDVWRTRAVSTDD